VFLPLPVRLIHIGAPPSLASVLDRRNQAGDRAKQWPAPFSAGACNSEAG